jgi:hypothetical protein
MAGALRKVRNSANREMDGARKRQLHDALFPDDVTALSMT